MKACAGKKHWACKDDLNRCICRSRRRVGRSEGLRQLFEGRHFEREIIVLCVRQYLCFKRSFRDPLEIMAEHGLSIAHTTIMRWVYHYAQEFERRWNRFVLPAGGSWHVDETYVKVHGEWVYLSRVVDCEGNTVKFRLRDCLRMRLWWSSDASFCASGAHGPFVLAINFMTSPWALADRCARGPHEHVRGVPRLRQKPY